MPAALRELIIGRAEGNPFYMEELVKMLVDQGAIETAGERWTLRAEKLLATQGAATLTGVLQARLDGLPQPERLALQQASVIGLGVLGPGAGRARHPGPRGAAGAGAARADAAAARRGAGRRARVRLQPPDPAPGDLRHRCSSAPGASCTPAPRPGWPARPGPRASDFLGAAAEHYELAGDSLQACEYFTRAAEHAKSRFAHDAALDHVGRALALLDAAQPADAHHPAMLALRWRLLDRARVHAQPAGQARRAARRARRDAGAGRRAGRRPPPRLAARRRSLFGLRTADYRGQESAARQAIALATRAGDDESRLDAQRLLADALAAQGDLAAAQVLARDGLAEARARGLRRVEGTFLNALSFIAELQDDQVAGLALDQQDLPIWRELGDRQGETIALGNVGADWLWFGEFTQARRHLEEALKIARAIGSRQMECGPLGQPVAARAVAGRRRRGAGAGPRRGRGGGGGAGARTSRSRALNRLGAAELALGQHEAAAEPTNGPSRWGARLAWPCGTTQRPAGPGWRWPWPTWRGRSPWSKALLAHRAAGEHVRGRGFETHPVHLPPSAGPRRRSSRR